MTRTARLGVALALCLQVTAAAISAAAAQEASPTRDYWPTEGWHTASPEDHGMDPNLTAQIDARVAAGTPLLSALLVVRGGDLVYEGYYNGHQPEEPIHIWSVVKSVTNIAVGIALQEGVLTDLDQTLGELIPDRIPVGADPRVAEITLEHLLTMTAGWEWDGRINFTRHAETDKIDVVLSRPLVCDPGVCYEYDNGCPNLFSFIIQELTGETMADYLQTRLFDPLGIEQPEWLTTEQGWTRGAGGLELSAGDTAKLGYLYLNQGRWDGEQIVDADWVEASTSEQSSGVSALSGVNIGAAAYGYLWWVTESSGLPTFIANGYGGQLIYVVPDLDLVVVTARANAVASEPETQQHPRPIIEELIVPAVLV